MSSPTILPNWGQIQWSENFCDSWDANKWQYKCYVNKHQLFLLCSLLSSFMPNNGSENWICSKYQDLTKASSLICLIGKKIPMATGEKLSTFFYSKVYQWQYKKAIQFVLLVAQKLYLQAWMAYSIFKYIHETEELW